MPSFRHQTTPAPTEDTVSAQPQMASPTHQAPLPETLLIHSASSRHESLHHKSSQESLPVELCEGPVSDQPAQPRTPTSEEEGPCSDRTELIERLKKGQSPTWRPAKSPDTLWNHPPVSSARLQTPERRPMSPSLLHPLNTSLMTPTPTAASGEPLGDAERLAYGLSIERPRSALHSGDFTHVHHPPQPENVNHSARARLVSGGNQLGHNTGVWLATSPPRDFNPFQFERRHPSLNNQKENSSLASSLSSSISSSFAYQPPTSPLVQSESNEEIDLPSPLEGIDIGTSFSRNTRRYTLMSGHTGPFNFSSSPLTRHPPTLRQERTFPYQAHQPRRSLTSTPSSFSLESSDHFPSFSRTRRPSHGADASPIQHASMVGSYEESILRGRMSTTPSKPLEFVAQIGVLGLGKCKSNLRCPPHVTLPFPAVFYSYATSAYGRSKSEDGPSPYVGQIDLENGLPNQEGSARTKRKTQTRTAEKKAVAEEGRVPADKPMVDGSDPEARRSPRLKRRSTSPRAPPGGSYRIPEKGQIQIIIKNPNKTAVKLFLVPYDLAGMEPGTKTFIRQRSYSAGPIIENMPSLAQPTSTERPTLRYLVHLHICCPSKGRYYLYKSIRVVFANRVPDGKERLRNEVSAPEPKFSSYKPIRVMHPPTSGTAGPAASLAAEKAFRRRSHGYYAGFGTGQPSFDAMDSINGTGLSRSHYPQSYDKKIPIEPVPFSLSGKASRTGADDSMHASTAPLSQSESPARPSTQDSSNTVIWAGGEKYSKLSPGDAGYGGNAFSGLINGSPAVAESLLSQRLRTLGVQGLEPLTPKPEGEECMDHD